MKQSKRVLILDDDPHVAAIVASTASSFGFEVLSISSPLSAVPVVRAWEPSQLVLDLSMPEKDGIEVIRDLAKEPHHFSLILMSGLSSKILESARTLANLHGFPVKAILTKPFCRSELRHALTIECDELSSPVENCSDVFTPSEEELQHAIDGKEFQLFYQPTVKVENLSLIGAEALVRWHHPNRGILAPNMFLEHLESNGLMGKLTDRVLSLGLKWLKATENMTTNLAVNVTGSDLSDLAFVDAVLESCDQLGVDPSRLTLEVTETSAVNYSATCLDVLTRFRIHGVRLAIDDFGTGHSTLTQLRTLPFSEIKIDRSFIQSMREDFESLAIVESIIGLGKDLGLVTVAEGVEDQQTLSILRSLGCEWAQGYLFSKPVCDAESQRLVSEWPFTVEELSRQREPIPENLEAAVSLLQPNR